MRTATPRSAARLAAAAPTLLALAALLFGPLWSCCSAKRPQARIALLCPPSSPALESCLSGLRAGLAETGCGDGVAWRMATLADAEDLRRQAALWADEAPTLYVVCSSPLAAALCRLGPSAPVVIAYCFDPLAAAGDPHTGRLPPFACGVASPPPLAEAVDLLLRLRPLPRRVGVVYNSEEAIAARQVRTVQGLLREAGVELVAQNAPRPDDVAAAAKKLVDLPVDAAWKLGDQTVAPRQADLLRAFADAGLPTVGDRQDQLALGAFAVCELDFEAAGRTAGRVAAMVLQGKAPAAIGVVKAAAARVDMNAARLDELGRSLAAPRR